MRRPRFRKKQTEVSLFPFLAVLICTMGGLIVLLVMVVQQARVDAQTVATARREQAEQHTSVVELRQGYEDQQWRRETLVKQRAAKTEELAEQRLALGHLEEHLRELQTKWKQLFAEMEAAELRKQQEGESVADRQRELDRLTRAIQQAQIDLEAARKKAAAKPRSYTIVPYKGPNGTRRRPIYLECRADGLMIQPAGMLLTLRDLQGPMGPGNPLDASLRAIREFWSQGTASAGEPYPLLLVRPDGVESYAGARNALEAWDDEFGYELIEADLVLEFPPQDKELRPLLEKTVADARRRQQFRAAAMPSRYAGRAASGFVATPNGGFAPLGGSSNRGSYGRSGRGVGTGAGTAETPGRSASNRAGSSPPPMSDGPTLNGPNPSNAAGSYATGGADPNQKGPNQNDPSGRNQAGRNQAGGERNTASAGKPRPAGAPGQQTPGGQVGGTAPAGHMKAGNASNLPGGSVVGGMSGARGVDWGLPNSNPRATGVTRPMRVACYPDRLLILADRGDQRPPKVVMLPESTANGVDAFVSAVWEAMEDWGIALAGGYWRPILQVEVQPGAERRFQELQALLQDSGLVVKRKQP